VSSQIKANVIRVCRTDQCGTIQAGATGQIVTAGFTSVATKEQMLAGKEFAVQNAWGDLCVNDLDCDRLKRLDMTIMLCDIDPMLIEFMTGSRLITDASTPAKPIGFAVQETPGSCNTGFSLELWTKVSGGLCSGYPWAHWLFPFVRYAVLGDWTFALDAITATVTASTQHTEGSYGSGPFNQWAPNIGATEHYAMQYTFTPPPTPTNGYAALAVGVASPVAA
jgi:hypothetical protein